MLLARTIHPFPRRLKPVRESRLSKLEYSCHCSIRRRRRTRTTTTYRVGLFLHQKHSWKYDVENWPNLFDDKMAWMWTWNSNTRICYLCWKGVNRNGIQAITEIQVLGGRLMEATVMTGAKSCFAAVDPPFPCKAFALMGFAYKGWWVSLANEINWHVFPDFKASFMQKRTFSSETDIV